MKLVCVAFDLEFTCNCTVVWPKTSFGPSRSQASLEEQDSQEKLSCFCGHSQTPAHRLNFWQREETPVWRRAKSLNKQSRRGRPRSSLCGFASSISLNSGGGRGGGVSKLPDSFQHLGKLNVATLTSAKLKRVVPRKRKEPECNGSRAS